MQSLRIIFYPDVHGNQWFWVGLQSSRRKDQAVEPPIVGAIGQDRLGVMPEDFHQGRQGGMTSADAHLALQDEVWDFVLDLLRSETENSLPVFGGRRQDDLKSLARIVEDQIEMIDDYVPIFNLR